MPGWEDPIIPNGGENPDSWDHQKIKNAFDPLLVRDAVDQADKYWQMRQSWEQGIETFVRSVQASLAQAWSGPAAEQAKQAIQDYIDKQARPVTPALEMLSAGVRNAAGAIVNTKNHVGEPMDTDGVFDSWWNPLVHDDEISRRTQEARVAMTTHYVTPFGQLDHQIPVIPVPTGPTGTTDIPAPPPGGYTGTPDPTTSETDDSTGATPGDTPAGETSGDPESETPPETSEDDQTGEPTTADPGDTTTTPAGTDLPGSTAPTVPASTTPSGVSTGPGSPGSPAGSPETPAPGRTVSGAPNTTQGAPAGSTAASAAAGNRGMGGMPMGAAGRGGGKDEESKRSTPDYLINQENTDELLGEAPRTIPGGVIGTNPD
ncbi:WXG100 family type VII secretion target [Nocardia sp. NPDC001965]